MSNINDDFNEFFKEQLLGSIAAPREITDNYCFQSCLKDSKGKQTFWVRSKADGKDFILKIASSEYEGELKNEFDTLISLQNASLPKAINYYEDGSHFYFLREYVKGTTLYNTVEENGIFEEQRAIEIAIDVCRNLNYLHHQTPPIIHRDVKPQNIILTPTGRIVLIDMGTARRFKPDAQHDTNFMGTQATAAPEQYGFGQTDERCDIYAVGVLLIFLMTGGFSTDKSILQTIRKPLRKVIQKCVALDRDKRYPNIDSLRAHLEDCMTKRRRISGICVKIALGIFLFAAGAGLALAVSKHDSIKPAAGAQIAAAYTAPIGTESISPEASGAATFQSSAAQNTASDIAPADLISSSPAVSGAVAEFGCPLIEKAVRLDLGKGDKEPIYESELEKVKHVMISGDVVFSDISKYNKFDNNYDYNGEQVKNQGTISDLDDIARLKNLETLILDKQDITDISVLKDLPLKILSLCGNKINDISVLQKCKGLIFLKVADNQITDISVVSALKHLEILDIGANPISSISPLSKLPIKELYLLYTRIDDYTTLNDLPALEKIYVNRLNSQQVGVIASFSHIKDLLIWNSGIETLRTLSKLTDLENLDVSSNMLTGLEGIEAFQRLKYLNIADNQIIDISPLEKILKLEAFNIRSLHITDFSVLLHMPYLQRVLCDADQVEKLNKLGKSLHFKLQT